MAWALSSGIGIVPFVCKGVSRWDSDLVGDWENRYRMDIEQRQWTCRALAVGLQWTRLVSWTVPVLSRMPWLARPVVGRLNRKFVVPAT
jgi:hypothetical protein